MQHRRRFKETESIQDRLASFAKSVREKASLLAPGAEQKRIYSGRHGRPILQSISMSGPIRRGCSGPSERDGAHLAMLRNDFSPTELFTRSLNAGSNGLTESIRCKICHPVTS